MTTDAADSKDYDIQEIEPGDFEALKNELEEVESGPIKDSILKNIEKLRDNWPSELIDGNKRHDAMKESFLNAHYLLSLANIFAAQDGGNIEEIYKGGHIIICDDGKLVKELNAWAQSTHGQELYGRYSSHYKADKIAAYIAEDPDMTEGQAEARFNNETPDFSLRAEGIFNESCMGTFERDGHTYSWFQFEGHSHQARNFYGNFMLSLVDGLIRVMANLFTGKLFRDTFFANESQPESPEASGPAYSLEKLLHHIDFIRYSLGGKSKNIGQYGDSHHTETSNPMIIDGPKSQGTP